MLAQKRSCDTKYTTILRERERERRKKTFVSSNVNWWNSNGYISCDAHIIYDNSKREKWKNIRISQRKLME